MRADAVTTSRSPYHTIHVVTGIEAAMFDLLGQHWRQRRFAVRRRSAAQRSLKRWVIALVGNRSATPLPKQSQPDEQCDGIVCAAKQHTPARSARGSCLAKNTGFKTTSN